MGHAMSKYIMYILMPGEEYVIGTHDQHSTDSRSRFLGHIMYDTQTDAEIACAYKLKYKIHGYATERRCSSIKVYEHAIYVKPNDLTSATGWIARIA
jgi:hypothetical protein